MNPDIAEPPAVPQPLLLFNGECAICRSIARWVATSARAGSRPPAIAETPIGDDPEALRRLNPGLDIWDAYATIHLLMPDGSMKLGGEAVAASFACSRIAAGSPGRSTCGSWASAPSRRS